MTDSFLQMDTELGAFTASTKPVIEVNFGAKGNGNGTFNTAHGLCSTPFTTQRLLICDSNV